MKKKIYPLFFSLVLGVSVLGCTTKLNSNENVNHNTVREEATEEPSETEAPKQDSTQTTATLDEKSKKTISSDSITTQKLSYISQEKSEKKYAKFLNNKSFTQKKPKIVVNPFAHSPLSAYVIFQTKKPCKVKATVCNKKMTAATQKSSTLIKINPEKKATKKHKIPVLGLYAGYKNKVIISCKYPSKKKPVNKIIRIKTKGLPGALAGAVKTISHVATESVTTGLTIISGQDTKYPYAYDENGDVRWYTDFTTGSYGYYPLANKRFMLETDMCKTPTEEKPQTTSFQEMDYMGRIYHVYFVKNGTHHEIIEKTPGGNLLSLTSSIEGHIEDCIIEINRKTGKIVKTLDMRDVVDKTYVNKTDWVHLNTVSYDKKDNSILISPRNLHSAMKIDWKTNKIKWIITNPKMFAGTAQEKQVLKPIGNFTWHFQQHSVYELKGIKTNKKLIMLYDNHWQTKRKVPFFDKKKQSNVTVYEVDEKNKTVTQKKLFPGVRSVITSNCYYEKHGNIMYSFGGYLHPHIDKMKGMVYAFDYNTAGIKNQYATKYYFYRGYKLDANWKDLSKRKKINKKKFILGSLQAPIKAKSMKIPEETADSKYKMQLMDNILMVHTSDHAFDKVRFEGEKHSYVMDYSSAGKGMASKKNQTYNIAIPLGGLKKDTYKVLLHLEGKWVNSTKEFKIDK